MTAHRGGWKRLIPVAKIVVAVGMIAFLLWIIPLRDQLVLPRTTTEDDVFEGEAEFGAAGSVVFRETEGETLSVRVSPTDRTLVLRVERASGEVLWPRDPAPVDELGAPRRAELHPGLLTVLPNAQVGYLLAALGLLFVGSLVAVYRWYLLLGAAELQTSLPRVFSLTFIGALFNNVMPGLTGGDLVKAFYIAREHRHRKTEAIITVLLDRVLGITGLAMVAAIVIPFDFQQYAETGLWIYGILGALLFGGVVLFSRRVRRAIRFDGILARLPLKDLILRVDEAVFIYRFRRRTVAVSLFLSMIVHTIIIAGIGMIGVGIGLETPFVSYFAIVPIGLIVKALPIAPAGWGVGDAAFVYFWATQGVPKALAFSLSVVYGVEQMAISLVGALCLAAEKERVSTQEVEEFAESDDPPVPPPSTAGAT